MDTYSFVTGLDEFQLFGLLDHKLQEVLGALVGGYLVAEDAPNELKLANNLVGHATRKDGYRWLVL